jgi:hypothetical protein
MDESAIRTDLQRCGAEMAARGAMMRRIGEKLKQRGIGGKPL